MAAVFFTNDVRKDCDRIRAGEEALSLSGMFIQEQSLPQRIPVRGRRKRKDKKGRCELITEMGGGIHKLTSLGSREMKSR